MNSNSKLVVNLLNTYVLLMLLLIKFIESNAGYTGYYVNPASRTIYILIMLFCWDTIRPMLDKIQTFLFFVAFFKLIVIRNYKCIYIL